MWAQEFLAKHSSTKHVLNDSKTPSGPVHIGSFRSLVIHDVLKRILDEEKQPAEYLYGFDDFDPMDDLPPDLKDKFTPHLGKPLSKIPSPSGKFSSFAEEYIEENKKYHQILGIKANYYQTSQLYSAGRFNQAIEKVLDQAATIRTIYQEVSGSKRDPTWLPIQVICPNCGKLGSTNVYAWDGHEVKFKCQKDLVAWAVGCGYEGTTSPFDGKSKMHWRVEWAAKWDLFGVTIESAGKDHTNKGGSFDTGDRILIEVFGKDRVARLPHEFFLYQGKKMSTSKGLAVTPSQALEVFSPESFRFLLVRNRPAQAIEINLTEIVPRTYDEYDRCQLSYLEKVSQDQADYFIYSQIDPAKIDGLVKMRFINIVSLLQIHSLKEELNRPDVRPRVKFAQAWLEKYAPTEINFTIRDRLPSEAKTLTAPQKEFLKQAAELIGETNDQQLQQDLYQLSQRLKLKPALAFAAIYLSLIGKEYGPNASQLILSQSANFIKNRFTEAAA